MLARIISCVVILAVFCHYLEACTSCETDGDADDMPMSIGPRGAFDMHDGSVYWPNGTVPYKYGPNFHENQKNLTLTVFNEFKKLCVNFVEMQPNDDLTKDYVTLTLSPANGRCSAEIGRIGGEQFIGFIDENCFRVHVLRHLVMHTLGFYHEHQRPDRDCFVRLKKQRENVQIEGNEPNLKINTRLSTVFPYDTESLMHYRSTYFDELNNGTGWERFWFYPTTLMSELDRYKVKYLYCNEVVGHPTNNEYNAANYCSAHTRFCERDRQIKQSCGYQPPM